MEKTRKPRITALKKMGLRLARPDIFFWTLPFLMILLGIGTIAQKNVGIFTSQQTYFSSLFFWVGPIPLPGGLLLISVVFVNLLAKFLLKSDWSMKKAGTIITHFGVLVLILGGLISFLTSREGYVIVPQGETTNIIEDYHNRQLVIREDGADKSHPLISVIHQDLHDNLSLSRPDLPFTLTITRYCFNCGIIPRPPQEQAGWTKPGKFMQLVTKPSDPQDEKNMTGVEFKISGAGPAIDGNYLTFDKFPNPPRLTVKNKTYTIAIERVMRQLPFSITLDNFKEDFHPGTDMAKSYTSTLMVTDGATSWPAIIRMNDPLRYRGYTLYQSGFDTSGDKPYTVLVAVENKGRIFPYLATLIITLGLIFHLGVTLWQKRKGRE